MAAARSLHLHLHLLFLLLILTTITSDVVTAAPFNYSENSTDFIYQSCGSTSYPDLCFTSLSSYACTIQQSPLQLAQVATNLSLSSVCNVSSVVSSVSSSIASSNFSDHSATEALNDCVQVLGDAADQMSQSVEQLKNLNGASGTELRFLISNVQTWMSAALTNEETCTDGLKEMGAVNVTGDVTDQVDRAKEYTSNALALVNNLANNR